MLPELAPFFPGPLRPYGEGLTARPAPPDAKPGARLADIDGIAELVRGYGKALGATDLPALASWWTRRYCLAIVPPVLVSAVVLERALPVSLDAIEVSLARDCRAERIHIGDTRTVIGHDFVVAIDLLVRQNLAPIFQAMAPLRASPRVLWSHAAEFVQTVGEVLCGHPAVEASRRAALAEWLANAGALGPAYRPLTPRQLPSKQASIDGDARRVRRVCCLNYRLPGEDYCGVCPLTCAKARAA